MVTTRGYGDMGYLARHLPFKEDPSLLLEGVQSAIVVIKNYKNTSQKNLDGQKKVARYAAGLDYHTVIGAKLQKLEAYIQTQFPEAKSYSGVDSRPLADRSLALKAGIGFRGKNTMVIRPKVGSYFFIGVILTTVKFEEDPPFIGTCGTCQRCIEACPTQALSLDGKMDIQTCISYQTIEKKSPASTHSAYDNQETIKSPASTHSTTGREGEAPAGSASGGGDASPQLYSWAFGCDICQEVCPFNHVNTPLTNWAEFLPESGVGFSLQNIQEIPQNTALYRSRKRLML